MSTQPQDDRVSKYVRSEKGADGKTRYVVEAVAADASDAFDQAGRERGEEYLVKRGEKRRGKIGNLAEGFLQNYFRETLRQWGIGKARVEMSSSGTIYGSHAAGKEAMRRVSRTTIDRFLSQHEGLIHEAAGEQKIDAKKGRDDIAYLSTKGSLTELLESACSDKKLTEKEFEQRKLKILREDLRGKFRGDLWVDNLWDIVQEIRVIQEHTEGLGQVDLELNLTLGKAKLGARTEIGATAITDAMDRLRSWGKKGRGGLGWFSDVFRSELFVGALAAGAAAVAGGTILAGKTKLAFATGLVGSSILSGVMASAREKRALRMEYAFHAREMAAGKRIGISDFERSQIIQEIARLTAQLKNTSRFKISERSNLKDRIHELNLQLNEKKRRQEIGNKEVDLERADAQETISLLRAFLEQKNLSGNQYLTATRNLYEADARVSSSDTHQKDFFSYSSLESIEEERLELDLIRAQLRIKLKNEFSRDNHGLKEDGQPKIFENFDEFRKSAILLANTSESKLFAEDEAKQKAFQKLSSKRALTRGLWTTAAVGVFGGVIAGAREVLPDINVAGLWEGLRKSTPALPNSPFNAILFIANYLRGHLPLVEVDTAHAVPVAEGQGIVMMPEGMDVASNGTDLSVDGHTIGDLQLTPDGTMTEECKTLLENQGYVVLETAQPVTPIVQETKIFSDILQWIHEHATADHVANTPEDAWKVHEGVQWRGFFNEDYYESTENELRLHWGGEHGTGLDANGNYVLDISHMTNEGSWISEDTHVEPGQAPTMFRPEERIRVQDLIREGKMRLYFSVSGATQHDVISIPVGTDGKAIIPFGTTLAKNLFGTDGNGQAEFLGRFLQAGYSEGMKEGVEHLAIVARVEGAGLDAVRQVVDVPMPGVPTDVLSQYSEKNFAFSPGARESEFSYQDAAKKWDGAPYPFLGDEPGVSSGEKSAAPEVVTQIIPPVRVSHAWRTAGVIAASMVPLLFGGRKPLESLANPVMKAYASMGEEPSPAPAGAQTRVHELRQLPAPVITGSENGTHDLIGTPPVQPASSSVEQVGARAQNKEDLSSILSSNPQSTFLLRHYGDFTQMAGPRQPKDIQALRQKRAISVGDAKGMTGENSERSKDIERAQQVAKEIISLDAASKERGRDERTVLALRILGIERTPWWINKFPHRVLDSFVEQRRHLLASLPKENEERRRAWSILDVRAAELKKQIPATIRKGSTEDRAFLMIESIIQLHNDEKAKFAIKLDQEILGLERPITIHRILSAYAARIDLFDAISERYNGALLSGWEDSDEGDWGIATITENLLLGARNRLLEFVLGVEKRREKKGTKENQKSFILSTPPEGNGGKNINVGLAAPFDEGLRNYLLSLTSSPEKMSREDAEKFLGIFNIKISKDPDLNKFILGVRSVVKILQSDIRRLNEQSGSPTVAGLSLTAPLQILENAEREVRRAREIIINSEMPKLIQAARIRREEAEKNALSPLERAMEENKEISIDRKDPQKYCDLIEFLLDVNHEEMQKLLTKEIAQRQQKKIQTAGKEKNTQINQEVGAEEKKKPFTKAFFGALGRAQKSLEDGISEQNKARYLPIQKFLFDRKLLNVHIYKELLQRSAVISTSETKAVTTAPSAPRSERQTNGTKEERRDAADREDSVAKTAESFLLPKYVGNRMRGLVTNAEAAKQRVEYAKHIAAAVAALPRSADDVDLAQIDRNRWISVLGIKSDIDVRVKNVERIRTLAINRLKGNEATHAVEEDTGAQESFAAAGAFLKKVEVKNAIVAAFGREEPVENIDSATEVAVLSQVQDNGQDVGAERDADGVDGGSDVGPALEEQHLSDELITPLAIFGARPEDKYREDQTMVSEILGAPKGKKFSLAKAKETAGKLREALLAEVQKVQEGDQLNGSSTASLLGGVLELLDDLTAADAWTGKKNAFSSRRQERLAAEFSAVKPALDVPGIGEPTVDTNSTLSGVLLKEAKTSKVAPELVATTEQKESSEFEKVLSSYKPLRAERKRKGKKWGPDQILQVFGYLSNEKWPERREVIMQRTAALLEESPSDTNDDERRFLLFLSSLKATDGEIGRIPNIPI